MPKFRLSLRIIFGLLFRSKKKHVPSPVISLIIPDPPEKDSDTAPITKEEHTYTVVLDTDVWIKILLYCEVVDIIHVGMTSRALSSATQDYLVWYHALLRISHDKRLSNIHRHIRTLSVTALRQKAILSAQIDRILHNPHFRLPPHATTTLSPPVTYAWSVVFVPGGKWLVMLCRFGPLNQEGIMLYDANVSPGSLPRYIVKGCTHSWGSMRAFTGDAGDFLLLLRADQVGTTTLGICLIDLSTTIPRLEITFTTQVPRLDGSTALGNYIAYGWTEPLLPNDYETSDLPLRHMIKVLKLTPSYQEIAEHCLMEAEAKMSTGRRPFSMTKHSYELRNAGPTNLIMLVSNKICIAAYHVPSRQPTSPSPEIVAVTPFWHFPCAQMAPRAVYLIPSMPAVESPSAIIFYQNRCLFLTPKFDTDPPGVHPSYLSTYTSPWELKRPLILGPNCAFWDLGRGRLGTRKLPAPLRPAFCEMEGGSWDLTGKNVPEGDLADDVRSVPLTNGYLGRLKRAAWDEESGRLAVLPGKDREWDGDKVDLFIIDVIN